MASPVALALQSKDLRLVSRFGLPRDNEGDRKLSALKNNDCLGTEAKEVR